MNIGSLGLYSSDLTLSFCALLKFSHLLTLHRWRSNLLAENNVTYFADRERRNVNAVSFAEILKEIREK